MCDVVSCVSLTLSDRDNLTIRFNLPEQINKYDQVCVWHVGTCHAISCHVVSCHVMSCHVMSYACCAHVMSCRVVSCHVM